MTKKEILGLLVPCIAFVWVAADLFLYANFYSTGEKDQLRAMQQKKVAEMVRKIQSGEYPQNLEVILADQPHKNPGFFGKRRLRQAVQLFQQVIELNPANWQSMLFVGKAFQSLGELEPALTWFLRAYDCVPAHPSVAKEVGFAAGR